MENKVIDGLNVIAPFTNTLALNMLLGYKDGELTYNPTKEEINAAIIMDVIVNAFRYIYRINKGGEG